MESKTLSVTIDCPPQKVYEFASNPENLPKWAKAFCLSIRKANGEWLVETPQGQVKISFVKKNDLGLLDHYVNPAPGVEIFVPMRVVPNGYGSEVIFTLFRMPGMTDEIFAQNIQWVERDLAGLKKVLESS